MKRIFTAITIFLLPLTNVLAHQAPAHEHTKLIPIPEYALPYGDASADAAARAAGVFLDSLDEVTRINIVFDRDRGQRSAWSNLPAGLVARFGVSVGELSDEQRAHLFSFLASSLSEEGYSRVMGIMAAEAFLSTDQRAPMIKWYPENYWVTFYGEPSSTDPWGWQFGGHHLALNISVRDNKVYTMSPSFVGTEPAVFTLDGVNYEVVIDMHHAGFAVFESLNDDQKLLADAGDVPRDVLTGAGNDDVIPDMIGIPVSRFNEEQRQLLLDAIDKWASIQPDENASKRMNEIASQLDDTHFAWTGSDDVNTPTYMRIQGPSLIIELLSTGGNVGQTAVGMGHYHTIYRNPKTDYGKN